eukprot:669194-Rhodomonas_salina.1
MLPFEDAADLRGSSGWTRAAAGGAAVAAPHLGGAHRRAVPGAHRRHEQARRPPGMDREDVSPSLLSSLPSLSPPLSQPGSRGRESPSDEREEGEEEEESRRRSGIRERERERERLDCMQRERGGESERESGREECMLVTEEVCARLDEGRREGGRKEGSWALGSGPLDFGYRVDGVGSRA